MEGKNVNMIEHDQQKIKRANARETTTTTWCRAEKFCNLTHGVVCYGSYQNSNFSFQPARFIPEEKKKSRE